LLSGPIKVYISDLNLCKNHGNEQVKPFNQGSEPVPKTIKNSRFCRVLGTGLGRNPKFEKGFQNRFLGTINL
jgi:hypothetical protein